MAETRVPLLLVGGGIGGLTTALALARAGEHVHVIEKNPEFAELGAGLQVAPNASRVLDRLGVLEAVTRHAVFPNRLVWMDALTGEQLTTLDLTEPFVERYGYRYFVMHRSDLLNTLVAACREEQRITLETSKDVIGFEDAGDAALVRCADGTTYRADAVIGADGLWSTLRTAIVGDGDPICSAYVAYRGAIPIQEISEHAGLDSVIVWTGPDMHLVQYPVRRGELYNQVAVFKSYRYRPGSDDWGTPDELDERFGRGVPLVRAALTKFRRNRRWPMYDRLPVSNWRRGRVALMGDAAHPMLQYLAQGACQAIEDADALGEAFAAYPTDRIAAFDAYQRERVPRTARVQTTARAWGDLWHVHEDELPARNALLRARTPNDYADSDWLYGYRVPTCEELEGRFLRRVSGN